jgi:hypothetical protein
LGCQQAIGSPLVSALLLADTLSLLDSECAAEMQD